LDNGIPKFILDKIMEDSSFTDIYLYNTKELNSLEFRSRYEISDVSLAKFSDTIVVFGN